MLALFFYIPTLLYADNHNSNEKLPSFVIYVEVTADCLTLINGVCWGIFGGDFEGVFIEFFTALGQWGN